MLSFFSYNDTKQAFKQTSKAINKNGLVVKLIFPNLSPLSIYQMLLQVTRKEKYFLTEPTLKRFGLNVSKEEHNLELFLFEELLASIKISVF